MLLTSQLAALEASGLIRLAATHPELEYLFRHVLVKEAAYLSLVKEDRRTLHLAVGETMEHLYANRPPDGERLPLLAHHFAEAGDEARALKYFKLAGDAAAEVYANAEAILYYTRALDIARRASAPGPREPSPAARGEEAGVEDLGHLYLRRGRALELSGHYDEALDNYADMEALAHERGDRPLELAALMARATVHSAPTARYDATQGQALCEQALGLARDLGDRQAEAKILWNLTLLHKFLGHWGEVIRFGEQSAAIAREFNLREQLAFTLNDMYPGYLAAGQMAQAWAAINEARELWQELGNLPMLADNLTGSADLHYMAGDLGQALAQIQEAYRISQSINNLWGKSYARGNMGIYYLERGEVDEGLAALHEAIQLGEQAGFGIMFAYAPAILGMAYGYLGAVERGFEVVRSALTKVEERFPAWQSFPLAVLAQLHVLNDNLVEAEANLRQADRFAPEGEPWSQILLVQARCELGLAQADYTRVVAMAEEFIAALQQFRGRAYLADARYLKGRAVMALGPARADEAYAILSEARGVAEAMGSRRALCPILATLSELEARRGRTAEALALRLQAREVVEYIAGHIGSPELRASFLNLPTVRNVMRDA